MNHHVAICWMAFSIAVAVVPGSVAAQEGRQTDQPSTVTVHRGIEYARAGGKRLLLDVYVPRDSERPPLVVWIHGGAWRGGDKGTGGLVRWMTEHGYAVASTNYRLSQEAIFPAQIHDCKAAIRWLRAQGQELGYDAERIAGGPGS